MTDAAHELRRGCACYPGRTWMDAYKALSLADQAAPLDAEDIELLATSAYMIGRDDDLVSALERAPITCTWTAARRCGRCAARSGSAPT